MKKMIIGLYTLTLMVLNVVMTWNTGFPTYVCWTTTILLWLSAGLAGVLMLGVPPLTPKLYWGKPVWDRERILTFCCFIAAGPIMLIFITIVSHPIFLHDKSVRDIMKC